METKSTVDCQNDNNEVNPPPPTVAQRQQKLWEVYELESLTAKLQLT